MIAVPAASSPWIAPTTMTRAPSGSPRRITSSGVPSTDVPNTSAAGGTDVVVVLVVVVLVVLVLLIVVVLVLVLVLGAADVPVLVAEQALSRATAASRAAGLTRWRAA
jgi:hypothetical protein